MITLAKARELHAAARALKRPGIDPAADKQATKRGEVKTQKVSSLPTFAELTNEWLETWSENRSKRYVGTVKTRLERDILPHIGKVKIDQLESSAMTDIVTGIQNKRKAADLARRSLQKMKQILRFAKAKGYIKSSPIADVLRTRLRVICELGSIRSRGTAATKSAQWHFMTMRRHRS